MSLENAIQELTAEIRNLQEALQQRGDAIADLNSAVDPEDAPYQQPIDARPPQTKAPAAPPQQSDVEGGVDEDGLPWDDRIHASTKTKNANGTWKLKRGVDKDLVRQVRGELFAKQVQPSTPTPAPQQPAPTQTPAPAAPPAGPFAPVAQQPQTAAPTEEAPVMAYADVQARAADVSRILGAQAMKIQDLLSRFGVSRLSALQPNQYPGFVDGLNRLANGGEA